MNSEIRAALNTDLRRLVGDDLDFDVNGFPVESQEKLAELAQAGYEIVDFVIRVSVRPNAKTQLEATVNIQEAIDLVKLHDLVLTPRALARYIEGAFTCVRLFAPNFRASFVLDTDCSVEFNPFGDSGSVFPTMLFYACMSMYAENLTPKVLCAVLRKMRTVLYPTSKSSLLSSQEEEFATEVLDLFFIPSQVGMADLTSQIVSIVRKISFSESEISRGRSILEKSSKLSADLLSDECLGFFTLHYFSNGDRLFANANIRGVGIFLSIVALFSSFNVALPGQVVRSSWMDKVADRIVKVDLINRISTADVEEADPSTKKVGEIFSAPISNFSKQYAVPAPYEFPASPLLMPQKSPGSPPTLDDGGILEPALPTNPEKSAKVPVIQVLPAPTCAGQIKSASLSSSKPSSAYESHPVSARDPHPVDNPEEALELVTQSLIKSGMSPTRSARIATQFVAGGTENMQALNRVLHQAQITAKRRASHDDSSPRVIVGKDTNKIN